MLFLLEPTLPVECIQILTILKKVCKRKTTRGRTTLLSCMFKEKLLKFIDSDLSLT
jgi:hypothetical protein